MKLKFTLLAVTAFTFFGIAFLASKQYNKLYTLRNHPSHEGMEEDAGERQSYDLRRLADPETGKIPDNIRMKELAYAATLPNDGDRSLTTAPLAFANRGPWNVGGRTRAFGIDVNDENRLLAGSCSGGMWLSTNGGASWTETNTPAQLKNASCLVQDKRAGHTNTWYYGSGESYGASASGNSSTGQTSGYYLGDGLFKSTDNGASWQPIASTAAGSVTSFSLNWQLIWNIATDVSDNVNDKLYFAAYDGIYKSLNGGTTFSLVRGGFGYPNSSYFTDVQVTITGVVYATLSSDGTHKGIWRSPDGVTFTKITPLTGFPAEYNRIKVGINPNNENEVYFLAHTPGAGKLTFDFLGDSLWNSLWKYTYISGAGDSAGGNWQNLSANLPATGTVFDVMNVQGSYDMVVKVKPGSSNTVFIGGTNLYRSTTGFQDSTHTSMIGGYVEHAHLPVVGSWLNHHPDQHCLEFSASNPNVMYSSNDGGVFKTLNNTDSIVSWQSLNNGYLTSMFYTCAIDHATSGNNIIIGGAQDNGSWYTNNTSPTTPWVSPRGGDGSYCAIADHQSNYYFSIQNAKMMKATLDASGNVTGFARIDPRGIYNTPLQKKPEFINPFTLDPNNNNIMYMAGGKYLYRNDDLSGIPLVGNWDSINTNWTKWADSVPTANSIVTAVTACKIPANRVYYGTDAKKVYRVDNANVGTPTPVDITPTSGTVIFPNAYVTCITVDPLDGNKVFVCFSNYGIYSIFYSEDGGTTWSKQGGNLEQYVSGSGSGPSVRWLSIMHVADGTVYLCATSTGLYATDFLNGTSTNWVQQGFNTIGNAVCDMIDVRQSDGLIVVATHANGIYSATITSVGDIARVNEISKKNDNFQLTSFPNPMSQSATIELTLSKHTNVNLQILDDCGRLVETLINEPMQEGKHSVTFERKNLASGLYYYTLTADNRRKTDKLIISK